MDDLDGTLERSRDGVGKSSDEGLASVGVSELLEFRVEEGVRLADGGLDRQPVTSNGGTRRGEPVAGKPFLDSGVVRSSGLGELDDLQSVE